MHDALGPGAGRGGGGVQSDLVVPATIFSLARMHSDVAMCVRV
jgi:hypothetical protein